MDRIPDVLENKFGKISVFVEINILLLHVIKITSQVELWISSDDQIIVRTNNVSELYENAIRDFLWISWLWKRWAPVNALQEFLV